EAIKKALMKAGIAENLCDISVPMLREYDKNGRSVSGGEAQKIAIARAFLKDPHTYILDEPSSALDPITEYNLGRTLFEMSKDKTVIFISHRLSTTCMADHIYMLEQGRIIEEGNHEELLAVGGRYAEMFKKQAEKYKEAR
ncbi:MAG: ABC transporter ATP-binding protein/permease, partial [Lachnospiraceae bacterium]|nr:ABC transporter ATP-binding protein/permease [Lachnospiraceae bacterium]